MNATTSTPQTGHAVFSKTRLQNVRRHNASNVFYLWFKFKGHAYRESLKTTDERLAEKERDKRITEIKNGAVVAAAVTNGKMTLNELLTRFLEHTKERVGAVTADAIKESSLTSTEQGIDRIRRDKPTWLDLPATKLSADDLRSYAAGLGKETSASTHNRVVGVFKGAYTLGCEKNWIADNPALKVKRAAIHLKSDVVISDKQFDDLINWLRAVKNGATNKFKVIDLVEFLRYFGVRISQASNLEKSDVELNPLWRNLKTAVVGRIHLKKEFGKTAKTDRWLPIIREAAPLIERLLEREPNTFMGKVQRENKLLPIGNAYGLLNRAYKALGFDEEICGHHHFRHLAATKWRECGLDFKVIGHLLGHSRKDAGKLAMNLYAHVRSEAMDQELGKITWNNQPTLTAGEKVVVGGRAYTPAELEALVKRAQAAEPKQIAA